jgi:hypothetical protein
MPSRLQLVDQLPEHIDETSEVFKFKNVYGTFDDLPDSLLTEYEQNEVLPHFKNL